MPYEVLKRVPDKEVTGLQMDEKHKHYFREDTSFRLPDDEAAQARDIRQRFGQDRRDGEEADVLVVRIPDKTTGNMYHMGIEFDEEGNRI